MPAFDVSVVGELNLDMIMSGLPSALELDREYLASDFNVTLGSSSAIFTHNLASLGSKVAFSSSIGSDSFGEICLQHLELVRRGSVWCSALRRSTHRRHRDFTGRNAALHPHLSRHDGENELRRSEPELRAERSAPSPVVLFSASSFASANRDTLSASEEGRTHDVAGHQ